MLKKLNLLIVLLVTACGTVTPPPPTATIVPTVAPTQRPPEEPSSGDLHPILGDVRVRRAILYCTNRRELIEQWILPYPNADPLMMDSFLPKTHWAHVEGLPQYDYDPAQGRTLLDEAGWTLPADGDFRRNAEGEELAFKFTSSTAQRFLLGWGAILEANLANCGVRLIRLAVPNPWWRGETTGLQQRDFEMGSWQATLSPSLDYLYDNWACDRVPNQRNGWKGSNYTGWCDFGVNTILKATRHTFTREKQQEYYGVVQKIHAEQAVSLPLFIEPQWLALSGAVEGARLWPGETNAVATVWEWQLPTTDTLRLGVGSTEEFSSTLRSLVEGVPLTTKNYDYGTNLYFKRLPTVENGGAVLEAVEPSAGTLVVAANGQRVELQPGMRVIDETGAEVEWVSGIKLAQLTLTWELEDNIRWSDGEPLKAADMELAYGRLCASTSTNRLCTHTARLAFTDTSQTITLLPGYTPADYVSIYGSWQPAHRPLADWQVGLVGTGPYIATGAPQPIGEYGAQTLALVANPFFYRGALGIPKLILIQLDGSSSAADKLLTGELNVLYSSSFIEAAREWWQIKIAEGAPLKILMAPGNVWEQVGFNLYLP